jgi:hypothetical protein
MVRGTVETPRRKPFCLKDATGPTNTGILEAGARILSSRSPFPKNPRFVMAWALLS